MGFNCPHCSQSIDNAIPKERFDEVNKKRGELETQLSNAQRQAAQADALATQLDAAQKELGATKNQYKLETTFLEAGLTDPSEREVFGYYFQKQAGNGGITEPSEWLQTLRAPEAQVPAALAKLLPGQQPAAPASAATQPRNPAAAPPPANAGAKPAAATPPAFTAADIKKMSPAEFGQNYEAIRAAHPNLGLPPRR